MFLLQGTIVLLINSRKFPISLSMEILQFIFTEGIEEKLFLFTLLFGEEKRFGNQVMRITKFVTEFLSYMCQIRRHKLPPPKKKRKGTNGT